MRVPRRRNIPIAVSRPMTSKSANIRNTSDGIYVTHREFIGNLLVGTTNFALVVDEWINPGNVTLFPWMANIAKNYEDYTILTMMIHYVPLCPTTTLGQVVMQIDYDASDQTPISLSAMLNSQNAVTFAPYAEKKLFSTRQQLNKAYKSRFVDAAEQIPPNTDPKTLHAGILYVVTEGVESGTTCGALWIEYQIHLKTPQVKSGAQDESDAFLAVQANSNGSLNHIFTGTSAVACSYSGQSSILIATPGSGNWDMLYFTQTGYYLFCLAGYQTNIAGSPAFIAGTSSGANLKSYPTTGTQCFSIEQVIAPNSSNEAEFFVMCALEVTSPNGHFDLNLTNNSFASGQLLSWEFQLLEMTESQWDAFLYYSTYEVYINPGNPFTIPPGINNTLLNQMLKDKLFPDQPTTTESITIVDCSDEDPENTPDDPQQLEVATNDLINRMLYKQLKSTVSRN